MAKVILDTETGEVKGNIAYFRTAAQQEAWISKQKKEQYRGRGKILEFVACYHDAVKEVTQQLSLLESGAVMKLLLHMKINGHGLLQKGGQPLKQSDLQQILGKGKTQTISLLNKLTKLSILISEQKGRSKVFYVNEELHGMGKLLKKPFTKLMRSKLSEIVNDLPLNQLGFLYKVLPYFHRENCYLTHNPDELAKESILYMNREGLSLAINYSTDEITKLVRELRKKGLLMTSDSNNSVLYRVHPDLMYRQNNNSNNDKFNVIRDEFEAHRIAANQEKKK